MKFREKIQAVSEIPSQVKQTVTLAISALIVALIALSFAMVGAFRNAN